MTRILMALVFSLFAINAFAHSPLESTSPKNGAKVSEMPAELALSFKGSIRLTKVELTHDGGSKMKLSLDGHKGFLTEFSLPLQDLGSGNYRIEWRGLGNDGHALKGEFSFEVK